MNRVHYATAYRAYVISRLGVWMPGSFRSRKAARLAFRLGHADLVDLRRFVRWTHAGAADVRRYIRKYL